MKYKEALNIIHSKQRFGSVPGLKAISALLCELGNPQDHLKFVHVAGTNGKGSTTKFLSSVLCTAGYKTGMYISPYVVNFRERFQINGKMMPKKVLCELLEETERAAETAAQKCGRPATEFEILTAIALLWFYRSHCDIVCFEVGLGGRLDATNVIPSTEVAIITSIGLDHTEQLGDTLAKIAAEKAAIIKPGCSVICYPKQAKEARKVIETAAASHKCGFIMPKLFELNILSQSLHGNEFIYKNERYKIKLAGQHQIFNALCAIECIFALRARGYTVPDEALRHGLNEVTFAARIEILCEQPLVIIDGGHNMEGVQSLTDTLKLSGLKRLNLVMGVLGDKPVKDMLCGLKPYVGSMYTVTPDNPRAMTAQQLAQLAAEQGIEATACKSTKKAVKAAMSHDGDGMLVAGSLYLASEVREVVLKVL